MLAARDVDLKKVRFPVLVSPKLDGIRAVVLEGRLLSRRLKLIPNRWVQARFGGPEYEGLDGELIFGPPIAKNVFNATQSAVMSEDDRPDVTYYVFDYVNVGYTYQQRLAIITAKCRKLEHVKLVQQVQVEDLEELMRVWGEFVTRGYEGAIMRSLDGRYKYGRSTANEQYLMKLKHFVDDEAVVVGYEELMHNDNPQKRNELGLNKRSNHKANMRPGGTLGALIVENKFGRFNIGSGFDQETRDNLWKIRDRLKGKIVTFKYMSYGMKDVPRTPIYKGFRDWRDT